VASVFGELLMTRDDAERLLEDQPNGTDAER
jgi:hypothetical protein